MTTPTTPVDLSGSDVDAVLSAYRGLALKETRALRRRQGAPQHAPRLEEAQVYWSLLDVAAVLRGDLAVGLKALDDARREAGVEPAGSSVPAPVKPEEMTAADRDVLDRATHLAITVAEDLRNLGGAAILKNTFGGAKSITGAVLDVLEKVGVVLRQVFDATTLGTVPPKELRSGFVLSATLPAGFVALASGIPGKVPCIRVRPGAVRTGDPKQAAKELVPALLHEASHVLPTLSTLDLAYRDTVAFRLLPLTFRPANAAHFEQAAIEMLELPGSLLTGLDRKVSFSGADDLDPAALSAVDRAAAILQVRVVRAWVYSFRLSGSGISRVTDEPRALFDDVAGAPLGNIPWSLRQEIYDDLFEGAAALMRILKDEKVPGENASGALAALRTEAGTAKSAPTISAASIVDRTIDRMLADLNAAGRLAFPDALRRLIQGCHRLESKALGDALGAHFEAWGARP
ncbi:hypothetical protein GCM10009539_73740 [Cryptosporangium japonicum]|uniref:Uncharacterized protein n=2 Tax=Cryptosporangium japonicum TaxID=80872 RepID=A0ABN0V4P6_9ACTN